MGCFCGGMPGDVFSSYVCDTAQPFSHWMVDLIADDNSTDLADGSPFRATLYERAGTPPCVRSLTLRFCSACLWIPPAYIAHFQQNAVETLNSVLNVAYASIVMFLRHDTLTVCGFLIAQLSAH